MADQKGGAFGAAFNKMGGAPVDDEREDKAKKFGELAGKASEEAPEEEEASDPIDPADEDGVDMDAPPDWVLLPPDWAPPAGRRVIYVKFKAEWTENKHLGDRQCVMMLLTDRDEKVAMARCKDDGNRLATEFTKQSVRVIDGVKADWSGSRKAAGSVERFFDEIGPKCRGMLKSMWARSSQMGLEEQASFFESCVAYRTAGGG